jgi:hypothetical protein
MLDVSVRVIRRWRDAQPLGAAGRGRIIDGLDVDVETDQNVAELLAEQDDDKSLKEREDTKANRN